MITKSDFMTFANCPKQYWLSKNREDLKKPISDDAQKHIDDGVKVGEVSGQVLIYDHHYATYIKNFDNELEINLQDTLKYISGDSLNIQCKRGFVLLKYMGINIDIAKSDGSIIKNRYPKYLRKKPV